MVRLVHRVSRRSSEGVCRIKRGVPESSVRSCGSDGVRPEVPRYLVGSDGVFWKVP